MTKPRTDAEFRDHFLARVGPPNERGCTEWLGYRTQGGYGQVGRGKKVFYATHVALLLHDGLEIPAGSVVMHACDNPPCVNPLHLRRGTHQENDADRVAKGRTASGDKNGSRTKPDRLARGERSGHAKLSAAQVLRIRELCAAGLGSRAQIAASFNVSKAAISAIHVGRNWRHELLPRGPKPKQQKMVLP